MSVWAKFRYQAVLWSPITIKSFLELKVMVPQQQQSLCPLWWNCLMMPLSCSSDPQVIAGEKCPAWDWHFALEGTCSLQKWHPRWQSLRIITAKYILFKSCNTGTHGTEQRIFLNGPSILSLSEMNDSVWWSQDERPAFQSSCSYPIRHGCLSGSYSVPMSVVGGAYRRSMKPREPGCSLQ